MRGSRNLLPVFVALLLGSGCIKDTLGEEIQSDAVAYLVDAQRADGGWAAQANGTSDFSTTCWVVLALAAADAPSDVLQRARTFLEDWAPRVANDSTGSLSPVNPVALYALVGLALDVPDARWNGTDPLARLEEWAGNASLVLNEKIFVVGALGRAGRTASLAAFRDEIRAKLDGGNESELVSDAWFRSFGILAMLASGDDTESQSSRQWARSLLPFQKEESGFRSSPQYEPDASTTAAVLTVLTKVRFVYSSERTAAWEFLDGLQQPEGWIRFSGEYDFGRDKTTAEAILGITGAGVFGA